MGFVFPIFYTTILFMACSHHYEIYAQRTDRNDLLYSLVDAPQYLSVFYHRSAARQKDKGRWCIAEKEEALRFYCANENNNFSAECPGLWHIETSGDSVGVEGEIIAFFPAPQNLGDFWHGYPFTFSRKAPIARIKALRAVADEMYKKNKISLGMAKKIRNGSI